MGARFEVLSVVDAAVVAFARPVFVPTVGAAVRSFQDEVNRNAPENNMFNHPEDFSLYHLGSFDEGTGRFELLAEPVLVLRAKDVKKAV